MPTTETLRIYQVDAFHHQVLRGNPAAVIPLAQWLPDAMLQAIALENNLSETAFFLPEVEGRIPLRWFTPVQEVRLCGHATLATAHVLFQEIGVPKPRLTFETLSGPLYVERMGGGYQLDFPADLGTAVPLPDGLEAALGVPVLATVMGKDDLLAIVASEAQVVGLQPDLAYVKRMGTRGLLVSAPGEGVDFVSRCFFPQYGIDEDPVTGSAHTLMTTYWSGRLGKDRLTARQVSAREGLLTCTHMGDRVLLEGQAVTYMRGYISVGDIETIWG